MFSLGILISSGINENPNTYPLALSNFYKKIR
jgi:hypothetical protein